MARSTRFRAASRVETGYFAQESEMMTQALNIVLKHFVEVLGWQRRIRGCVELQEGGMWEMRVEFADIVIGRHFRPAAYAYPQTIADSFISRIDEDLVEQHKVGRDY